MLRTLKRRRSSKNTEQKPCLFSPGAVRARAPPRRRFIAVASMDDDVAAAAEAQRTLARLSQRIKCQNEELAGYCARELAQREARIQLRENVNQLREKSVQRRDADLQRREDSVLQREEAAARDHAVAREAFVRESRAAATAAAEAAGKKAAEEWKAARAAEFISAYVLKTKMYVKQTTSCFQVKGSAKLSRHDVLPTRCADARLVREKGFRFGVAPLPHRAVLAAARRYSLKNLL